MITPRQITQREIARQLVLSARYERYFGEAADMRSSSLIIALVGVIISFAPNGQLFGTLAVIAGFAMWIFAFVLQVIFAAKLNRAKAELHRLRRMEYLQRGDIM
jgi:hypothetical protein